MTPDVNSFESRLAPDDAWDLLSQSWSPARRQRLQSVASQRTGYLRLALQDVHDPHNVGACLRSADAFGLLDIDIINISEKFPKASTTSRGSRHWLDLHRFNRLDLYVQALRQKGYKIAAAYPSADALPLEKVPIGSPLVLAFGNEQRGLDEAWAPYIDYRFTIPMFGMVESFNISVSVALTLYELNRRCRSELEPAHFLLSETKRQQLLQRWAYAQSKDPEHELERLRQAQTSHKSQ